MARMHIASGSEGPSHDPYDWTEIRFTKTDGTKVTLRSGGLVYERLYVNGEKMLETFDDSKEVSKRFEELVGLSPLKAEQIYYARIYFEDPMGPPSRYM